jgi:methyl-accepting chemotaxis protein
MQQDTGEEWSAFVDDVNGAFLDALERNVEAQTQFVESWLDAVEESTDTSTETMSDGLDGYARAYRVWMNAAEQQFERTEDMLEGEDVTLDEFRDVWLNSANEAFKEVMSTSAFAAATGQTVEDAMEARQQVDEAAATTLRSLGFATTEDVDEVGERLVELERRQHAVESKLDRILDAVEDEA